jgi:hypothetical protein
LDILNVNIPTESIIATFVDLKSSLSQLQFGNSVTVEDAHTYTDRIKLGYMVKKSCNNPSVQNKLLHLSEIQNHADEHQKNAAVIPVNNNHVYIDLKEFIDD